MSRFAAPFLLALLPLLVFLALFPVATLDIGNPGWLIRGSDNGENALGLHAWLHDPAPVRSPRTTLLNAPEGVPLLFTDSNPLVALALKPIAPLLPVDAQIIGPWMLLCLVLNAVFAWLLLRRHAPDQLALWCGVVLLAFPPTLAARFVHGNLMAHWTILAALLLFLDRERGKRLRWWAPLIAITALIHSYLLVMVGAIWASALLRRAWRGGQREAMPVAGHAAAILALVAALAWWLGVAGDYTPAGNYGAFAMPLDALWNPGVSAYSNVLPGIAQRPGRDFEGFQYLGFGGLLLLGAAGFALFRQAPPSGERAWRAEIRWLVPALIVFTLLAVSNRVDVAGMRLFHLPLLESMTNGLDAVRASGRLFWPVTYVLLMAALLAVYRLPRAGSLLAGLLLLQIADLTGMARSIHGANAVASDHRLFARTPDPRWDVVIADARDIAFMPGDVTADLSLFQEIAWRAVRAGRPVTGVYAARTSAATARRIEAERTAFARGELVPGRLYILLVGAPLPPAATPHLLTLDGFAVIAPSSPRSVS